MNKIANRLIRLALLLISMSFAIVSQADPTANFSYSFPSPCEQANIQFINSSSTLAGTLILTIWDFGDGNGSTVFSPKHKYTEAGNYTVTLTVQNSNGDFDVISQLVTVNPLPQVNFQFTAASQCVSTLQTFNNLSSIASSDLSYSWNLGDGTLSTIEDPDHLYSNPGTYTVSLTATSASTGCAKTFSKALTIHPEAIPDFTAENTCLGQAILFNNTSVVSSGSMSWLWDFGDGNTSTKQSPTHLYATAGSYSVILQITTDNSCITSTSRLITVYEQPVADFEVDNGCFAVEATFTNSSTFANSFSWSFGDGTTSSDQNPTHNFPTFGQYTVSLVSSNADGCKDSVGQVINVFPLPQTSFTIDPVCLGSQAQFNNTSQIPNGTLSYLWDFGDGASSSAINPKHTYLSAGTYTVTLVGTSDNDCSTSSEKQLFIYEQPSAFFSVADICGDSAAIFMNGSTGTGLLYEWDFGDGKTSALENPTHQYNSSGTYQVKLSASTGNSCKDIFTKNVTIHPLPSVNFVFDNACDTTSITFENLSGIVSGSVSYSWDFGDGKTSDVSEPSHIYPSSGTYPVTLTATSDQGCIFSRTKNITIFPRPTAFFEVAAVCDGELSLFTSTSQLTSGRISQYLWDFGDGTNSIVANPKKQYLNNGTYEVSLTVFSDKGCEDLISKEVKVNDLPIADFEVQNVCHQKAVTVINRSFINSGDLEYLWDFGDGFTSNEVNPSHSYASPGVYTISLETATSTGCSDIILKDVRLYELPEADAGSDITASQGFAVQLSASGGVAYVWSPIDGLNNSNIPNPIATPDKTTTYTVQVTDAFGCVSSDSVTLNIEEDFKLIVNNVFTPDGNGQNDTWVIRNIETFGTANVRVYDRNGTLVFQDKAYQNDWAGTRGTDILPDGDYYYLVTFSNAPRQYTGAVTIMRNRR